MADGRADLKALPALIGGKRLSFGSAETRFSAPGVKPGSVTPLAIIDGVSNGVSFSLDPALAEAEHIVRHPLVNPASVSLAVGDFLWMMAAMGVEVRVVDFDG